MEKTKRFLLINPPMDYNLIRKEFSMEAYLPPLGLLYIARPLEKRGHKVQVIDFVAETFTEDKLRQLLKKTDVVGITITSQVATSAAKLSNFIKETAPTIPIIIGGPHCTLQGKQVLKDISADIAVVGDGEETISEIVDVFEEKKKFADVRGIFYRENGEIKVGLPGCEIEKLDTIDFPSRHLITRYTYGKRTISGVTFFAKGNITSMVTTRGCPFRCRFCVSRSIFKKYRSRSAENVIRELEEIAQEYDSVFIVDDNFLSDKKRAEKIMDFLIEKRLKIEIWIAGIRVTDADKRLFKKMKKAGVKSIEFGIESGNQEVLDYYDKRITLDAVRNAVRLSKKTGFLTIGNFIIGAPIETEKHVNDSIAFAKELNLDFAFFYPYYYLKGSDIWEDAFKEGKIQEYELFPSPDLRRGLGNFTPEGFQQKIGEAYRRFYFSPRYVLSQFFRQLFVYRNFRVFKAGLKLFLEQGDENLFELGNK